MSLESLRLAASRIGLPAFFVIVDYLWLVRPTIIGIDARHYQRATDAWLAGQDPWKVIEGGIPYAAGPHTLLFYVPTSVLPLAISTWVWLAIGLLASVYVVRKLELPIWWVLFPPMFHATWNGNPQTLAVAFLLVTGPALVTGLASAAAVAVKLYAAVPLVRRWRDLVVAGVVLAALLLILPWQLYFAGDSGLLSHLATAWNGSAWRFPILIPLVVVALWVLRDEGAEWFAVPTLWPATQFYYTAMALPALVGRSAWFVAAFSIPIPLLSTAAVLGLAGKRLWDRRERARSRSAPVLPSPAAEGPSAATPA